MKIIISRKGFDSKYGGCPSPIINGQPISLPIPILPSDHRYEDINFLSSTRSGYKLSKIVSDLRGRSAERELISQDTPVHLDPDLQLDSLSSRMDINGWKPSFGQSDAALGHLRNQYIQPGDLFLFFGWFREAEWKNKNGSEILQYRREAADKHVLFGWLQIGDVQCVETEADKLRVSNKYPWIKSHPHMQSPTPNKNAIYIASEHLWIPENDKINSKNLGGGGVFKIVDENHHILTIPNQTRSIWSLPSIFESNLTYNNNPIKWGKINTKKGMRSLDSAKIGQEFVHTPTNMNEHGLIFWLDNLFSQQE